MHHCNKCRMRFYMKVNLKIHLLRHDVRFLKRELENIKKELSPITFEYSDSESSTDTDEHVRIIYRGS